MVFSRYGSKSFGFGVEGRAKNGWNGKQTNGLSNSLGYGKETDSQSSITLSGINTRNLHIGNDGTGEQAKAVYTATTTEMAQQLSGSLKNNFDKETVQRELDIQRTVSQNVQAANTEINQHLDGLKARLDKGEIRQTDYDEQIRNWQRGKTLLNALAVGLSTPYAKRDRHCSSHSLPRTIVCHRTRV